jgi:hypothetical protein
MTTNDNAFFSKISTNFYCEYCDYFTVRKFNFKIHNDSIRHKNNANNNENNSKLAKISKTYNCEKCQRVFNDRAGLWRHNKKCNLLNEKNSKIMDDFNELNEPSDKQLIMMLIKENSEFKNMMMKVMDNGTNNTFNTISNINSNNKTFNLQVFLNETCKDAMNITDFVNSIQLQLSDLENVGKVGYIEGISNIIIKNLKALDIEKRPVHCTDQKREVIYVKEDNIWEKEDETNKQLRKAIKLMAHKNICMLKAFREKYPDFDDGDSRRSTQYNKIVIEAMGGKGDNEYEKDTKIIKKITKVVGIDKN